MANAQRKVAEDQHALELTRARIYAYVHALQPLDGCEVMDGYQRGRELVTILAETSEGYDMPRRRLTLDECADVVTFMHTSEPRNRATFYKDLPGRPSIECGLHIVLCTIEKTLRSPPAAFASRRRVA
ncbi:MAG: hypothetical protein WD944_06530 [Steroidobacteraceae bacterium]